MESLSFRIRQGGLRASSILAMGLTIFGHVAFGHAAFGQASGLNRPWDPVVMTGADIPSLVGITPGDFVAFKYVNGVWAQIPVQVDERAWVDFAALFNQPPSGKTVLQFTDANTWTGADPDAALDSNDQIAFMAKDAGGRPAAFTEPPGIITNTGVEVIVSDPLTLTEGYVYLFRQSGGLNPGAGQSYVSYTFNLLSGNYKATYKTNGYNPENSNISTIRYFHHYTDRWINDELKILAPGASGVDILDRHKNLFAPNVCARSEETFSAGGGIFVINKNGPVRGIRSYMGANSGPYTQREHLYYQGRQDIITYLRVHDISAIMDFFDYNTNAYNMTYRNDLNLAGVKIDGAPDAVATGTITWETVIGTPGSLIMAHKVETNIPQLTLTSFYRDEVRPQQRECTGDRSAIGQSGPWMQGIPCTDPVKGSCPTVYDLTAYRYLYYEGPDALPTDTQTRVNQALNPLNRTTRLWR